MRFIGAFLHVFIVHTSYPDGHVSYDIGVVGTEAGRYIDRLTVRSDLFAVGREEGTSFILKFDCAPEREIKSNCTAIN